MTKNTLTELDLISEISKSEIFKNTQLVFKQMPTNKITLLTSLISSMIGIVLKDNQITAQPVEDTPFGDLARSLPDIENVIELKKRSA